MASLEMELDQENRPTGTRAKREEPQIRNNDGQPSRRPVLGTISTNIPGVRVQPLRAAKQVVSYDGNQGIIPEEHGCVKQKTVFSVCGKQPFTVHDENTCGNQKSAAVTSQRQTFAIHEDELSETALQKSQHLKGPVTGSQTLKAQLHPSVTSVHRPPLASVYQITSSESEEELFNSYSDSPMIVDTSISEQRPSKQSLTDIYYVNDYAEEIFRYLKEAEVRHQPKAGYMRKQPDITPSMRSILVDWLVEVAEEYKLQTETLYLAVSYIDRFLSYMSVLRGKLQLVGTAAMFIAAKYEEIYPPDVGEFVYITDDTYTKKQVLRMEHLILKVLSFDLAVPTMHYFVQHYAKLCGADEQSLHLAMYLCELTLLEADPFLRYRPSLIASSATTLSNYTLGRESWSAEMQSRMGYSLSDMKDCLANLHNTFSNAWQYPQQAVREKYKASKWHHVALLTPPSLFPM